MFKNQANRVEKKSSNQGFTLLEVLIAMAIFAIGILAVGAMQINSINGNASARRATEAATWAADRVERLIALPYNDPDLNVADAAAPHQAPDEGIYRISWTVAESDSNGDGVNDIKTIEVRVDWTKGRFIALEFIRGKDL